MTPSTPNKRLAATVERDTPQVAASDGTATASQGITQRCGSESSWSKDGGSPSKTNRLTPARAADAAPGAVEFPSVPTEKISEAHLASLRRTAFHAVAGLPNCSTRGL